MATTTIGELTYKITGDSTGLNTEIDKSGKKITGLSSQLKKAGTALIAFFAVGKAIQFGKTIIKLGSDAEETAQKFGVVFASKINLANDAITDLNKSFGFSRLEAQKLLSDTGDLLSGFGFTADQTLELSIKVQELGADLASFTNFAGGAEGASKALTSALLGERESVKALGIAILESDVKAKVKALEITGRFTDETDRQKKAIATLEIAFSQSKNAVGDFARSSSSTANQAKILSGNLTDLGVSMGQVLLPAVNSLLTGLNGLITNEDDLEAATDDLLKTSNEYREVLDKLNDSSKTLNSSEKASLELRKALLSIEISKNLKDINRRYSQNERAITRVNKALEILGKEEIKQERTARKTIARNDRLKNQILELEKLREDETLSKRELSNIDDKIAEVEKNVLSDRQLTVKTKREEVDIDNRNKGLKAELLILTEKRIEVQERLSKALKDGLISESEFLLLGEGLKENITSQIELTDKQIVKTKELTEAKTEAANIDKETENAALVSFLELSDEKLSKQISDGEKLLENETLNAEQIAIVDTKLKDLKLENQRLILESVLSASSSIASIGRNGLKLAEDLDKAGVISFAGAEKEKQNVIIATAVLQRASAIFDTVLNTSVAIQRQYADLPLVAAIPASIVAGTAGAIQIASIIAAPLPSFAVGTPELQNDAVIQGHKGEMIIPRDFSEAIRSGELELSGGPGGSTGASGNTMINNTIILDGEVISNFITEGTNNGTIDINTRALINS